MKFSNWTVKELISYLSLSKCGMDPHCVLRCSGEVHVFNGERKDGKPQEDVEDVLDDV